MLSPFLKGGKSNKCIPFCLTQQDPGQELVSGSSHNLSQNTLTAANTPGRYWSTTAVRAQISDPLYQRLLRKI